MSKYMQVVNTFWTGDTGRKMRACPDAQRIAMYLITCQSANMVGLYQVAIPTMCHEIGMSQQGATKGLQVLAEIGFAFYDVPSEWVFVPEMARFQLGESLKSSDNRAKFVAKLLPDLRKSPYAKDFWRKYEAVLGLPELKSEGALEGVQDSAAAGPKPPVVVVDTVGVGIGEKGRGVGKPEFDLWWKTYPKRIGGKVAGEKAWHKAVKAISVARACEVAEAATWLQERTVAFAASPKGQAGQFCPYPATWLNAGGYDDDEAAWQETSTNGKPADTMSDIDRFIALTEKPQ